MDFDIHKSSRESDKEMDRALRPLSFEDFSGQDKIVENLSVFVQAALRGDQSRPYPWRAPMSTSDRYPISLVNSALRNDVIHWTIKRLYGNGGD